MQHQKTMTRHPKFVPMHPMERAVIMQQLADYLENLIDDHVEDHFRHFSLPPKDWEITERKTFALQSEIARLHRTDAAPHFGTEKTRESKAGISWEAKIEAEASQEKSIGKAKKKTKESFKKISKKAQPSEIFTLGVNFLRDEYGLSEESALPKVREALIDIATRHAEIQATGNTQLQLLQQLVAANTKYQIGL